MAVFTTTAAAARAAVDIQRALPDFNARRNGKEHVTVKIGIHAGPCVAVNGNGALDYFGGTVNVAARVQNQSVGDDIVIAEALLQDPEVAAAFAAITAEPYETELAGLSSRFRLVRHRFGATPKAAAELPLAMISEAAVRAAAQKQS
jgi:class 3 adenylate cyclase